MLRNSAGLTSPVSFWGRLPMAREDGFFDDLARGLADGSLTRGKALRLMGAAVVGGTLGSLGIGEASADPIGCKRNGKNCTRGTQCCSGNCSGGTCQAQTTTTTSTSTTSTTPGCIPAGSPTPTCDQCCSGTCNPGDLVCCTGVGGTCSTGGLCCIGSRCDTDGTCCSDSACTTDSDCCSDKPFCVDGFCFQF
jgi:hypothetical protein